MIFISFLFVYLTSDMPQNGLLIGYNGNTDWENMSTFLFKIIIRPSSSLSYYSEDFKERRIFSQKYTVGACPKLAQTPLCLAFRLCVFV